MSQLRVRYLLAGVLGGLGAALLLAVTATSFELPSALAPVGLTDVLLGVLGLVLSTLIAIAGALVVADVRADVEVARAWQGIKAEIAVVGTLAETAPVSRIEVRYFAGPQDEGLRRILLAHRFVVPVPPPSDAVQRAPAHAVANAVAEMDGACTMTNAPAVVTYDVANALVGEAAKPGLHSFNCAPKLVASTATHQGESGIASDCGMRGLRRAKHSASKVRLAANAVPWWNWPALGAVASHRAPGGGFAADVIVLADRNGRDHNQALPDFAADVAAPSQPGCRGPPAGGRRLAAADLVSGRGGIGARSWSRAHTPVEPTEPVVIDNLGDRVPVGAAELAVIETYLDDVLRQLITVVEPRQDDKLS